MRILLPYAVLVLLLFFIANGLAKRSVRSRLLVLSAGWGIVALILLGTAWSIWGEQTDAPLAVGAAGLMAAAMTGYAVLGVQRRSRAAILNASASPRSGGRRRMSTAR